MLLTGPMRSPGREGACQALIRHRIRNTVNAKSKRLLGGRNRVSLARRCLEALGVADYAFVMCTRGARAHTLQPDAYH